MGDNQLGAMFSGDTHCDGKRLIGDLRQVGRMKKQFYVCRRKRLERRIQPYRRPRFHPLILTTHAAKEQLSHR